MMKTSILFALPGSGKSTLAKSAPDRCLDLETHDYEWIENDHAISESAKTPQPWSIDAGGNPAWPTNYLARIQNEISVGEYPYIFLTMRYDLPKMLEQENIEYTYIIPEKEERVAYHKLQYTMLSSDSKEIYRQRLIARGNNEALISYLMNEWDGFISMMVEAPGKKIFVEPGSYIDERFLMQLETGKLRGSMENNTRRRNSHGM